MASLEDHGRVQRNTASTVAALLRAGRSDMGGMLAVVNTMDVLELRYALAFLAGWWGDLVEAWWGSAMVDEMIDKLAQR